MSAGRSSRLRVGVAIAALIGICGVAGLMAYFGAGSVLRAVASVGAPGFVAMCAAGLLAYLPLGAAWRVLAPAGRGVALPSFVWARMVRDAAADVLPFSPVGGLVLGARAAMLRGMSGPLAFASSTVDYTTELVAQILFLALGVGVWLTHASSGGDPVVALGGGLALAAVAAAGLPLLQRYGARWARRLSARWPLDARAHAEAFTRSLDELYRRPRRLAASVLLHLVGWIASAAVVWLAIRLIGLEIDLASVIAMEAMICAVRSVGFFVPGALGVQEAGYAFIGPMFGLPPGAGLAVSLLKRAREIATGVVVLALHQWSEGRRLLRAPRRTPGGV